MCGRYLKQFAARAGDIAGSVSEGRVLIGVDDRRYRAHQLAWLYETGEWPAFEIDHKDSDATNNRFDNLRPATRRVNNQNLRRAKSGNKLGVLGVKKHHRRFMAQITIDGKTKYLGLYATPEEAHEVYLASKRVNHEGCTL
jgi:hypothetical protein